MVLLVMATAQPPDLPRLLVIIVVRVGLIGAANLAGHALKESSLECRSDVLVREELKRMRVVPFGLGGRFVGHAAPPGSCLSKSGGTCVCHAESSVAHWRLTAMRNSRISRLVSTSVTPAESIWRQNVAVALETMWFASRCVRAFESWIAMRLACPSLLRPGKGMTVRGRCHANRGRSSTVIWSPRECGDQLLSIGLRLERGFTR